MNLENYIAELLENHDCVIVPAFGGFIANYAPASINAINDRFDPPYRKLSFNKFLVHNDGLLAAYVAQKEQEKYEESLERVKNYALYLKKELRDHKRISINKVGIIYLQLDGTFRFEQIKNEDFFKYGFGLESFFAKRIERQPNRQVSIDPKTETRETLAKPEPKVIPLTTEQASTPITEPKKVADEPVIEVEIPTDNAKVEESNPEKKRNWAAAAAIISLPIIGLGIWFGLGQPLFSNAHFNYSNFNPFTEKAAPEYEKRSIKFYPKEFSPTEALSIDKNAEFLEINLENEADKTLVVKLTNSNKVHSKAELRFHIIGGCFSVQENAVGLAEKYALKGSNASLLDVKGNLHRVSVASYATKKEAKAALASIQNDIPGAWILYK